MRKTETMPSYRQLGYFIAVATQLSYRKVARQLGVSQPTLSAQIASLEERMGVTLFERSRAGTMLSAQGRALLPHAKQLMQSFDSFAEFTEASRNDTDQTFRLGVPPTLGPYLLPHVLPKLHARYQHLKFYVREDSPKALEDDLLSGNYDLILTPVSLGSDEIASIPLLTEPLKLILPADHPLATGETLEPSDLKDLRVLTLEDKHHFHHQVAQVCDQFGAQVLRDYEGTSLDTLRQMVVMGLGAAFLPGLYVDSELHKPDQLHVCEIANYPISRQHVLAWRYTAPNRVFFRQLAQDLREIVSTHLSDFTLVLDD